MTTLRIATRSSAQARTQAEHLGAAIASATPGTPIEYVFVDTSGDLDRSTPLHQLGGQGIFVKEVQRAVLEGRADVAAHSAKDLPSAAAEGLVIGAFTERRSANDAMVGARLAELAHGATVATGSVRRRSQIARIRPDLEFAELRGNIPTRLEKIPAGGAIVMAVAALEILGLTERIAEILDVEVAVPMVGQGCVAVECRAGDGAVLDLLAAVDHALTRRQVECERAFLAELGAGCSLPVGAHLGGDGVFRAYMAAQDGSDSIQIEGEIGPDDDHLVIGAAVARECRDRLARGGH